MNTEIQKIVGNRDIIEIDMIKLESLMAWRDRHKDYVRNHHPAISHGAIVMNAERKQDINLILFDVADYAVVKLKYIVAMYGRGKVIRNTHEILYNFKTFTCHTISVPDRYSNYWVGLTSFNASEGSLGPISNEIVLEKYFEQSVKNLQQDMVAIYAALTAYLTYYKEDQQYIQIEKSFRESAKNRHKKNKKNSKKKIRVSNVVYRIKEIDAREQPQERTWTRHTDAWRVRGHWRTYKSGKKVWVKEHIKGNKENEIKPKTFSIDLEDSLD